MIWDPTKTFSCLCKEGYKGELCEKGIKDETNVLDMLIAWPRLLRMYYLSIIAFLWD